jgi:hypothetical protein
MMIFLVLKVYPSEEMTTMSAGLGSEGKGRSSGAITGAGKGRGGGGAGVGGGEAEGKTVFLPLDSRGTECRDPLPFMDEEGGPKEGGPVVALADLLREAWEGVWALLARRVR